MIQIQKPSSAKKSYPYKKFLYSLSVIIVYLLIGLPYSFSQIIVFSENFDNSTSLQPWSPYFSKGWFSKSPLNVIQSESGRGNVLKVNFPSGTIGSQSGFGNYRVSLDSAYKELYLSWESFVPADFDYGWADGKGGGKFFGGFAGGSMTTIPNNDNTDLDGWASILMWQNGYYSTYNYFKGTTYSADGWPYGSRVASILKGQWRRITIRLKINDGDNANGIFEVFDGDVLVYQQTNVKVVNASHPEYLIEHIYLNCFYGGNEPGHVCPATTYLKFDNLVAFYYPPGTSEYRSGASEKGRILHIPKATSYHPIPPNKFNPGEYTSANGTITSHCAFYQPVEDPDNFKSSTIVVSGATRLKIDVTKFEFDPGMEYSGYMQILKIYQGTGTNKILKRTFQKGIGTIPGMVDISGNSATIEWQAGSGLHGGFSLNYSSDGLNSENNPSCRNYVAKQGVTSVKIPVTPSEFVIKSIGNTTASFQWKDNSDNESWFEIERRGPNNSTLVKIINVDANSNTFSDKDLQSNSVYTYRIRAYNIISGASAWTSAVEAKTTVPVPAAPTALILKTSTVNSITIQWNDNADNEDKFIIERTGPDNSQITQTFECTSNTTSYIDNGLIANSTYTYRIRAYNSISGYSAYSAVLTAKTLLPPPNAPVSLRLKYAGSDSATIQWTDNSSGETSFEIERRGPNNNNLVKILVCKANSTEYTDTTLQWGSLYTYTIRAFNSISGYSLYSNVLQVQTASLPLPNAPSKLQGKIYTNESITLRWNDNSVDEKGFVITRSLALDNGNSTTFNLNANDTLFTDTGLEPNQSYIYAVKAVNEAGSSPFSNRNIASTLSIAETKRVKNDLIAYYNFNYIPGNVVHDLSGFADPLNLRILQPDYVNWNLHKKLRILSNTEIASDIPAEKIVNAVRISGEITVECWIKPDEPMFSGESRIISIGADESHTGFVLNQIFTNEGGTKTLKYSARMQTESTNDAGYPEISQKSICESISLSHVIYRRDIQGNEALFVNGKKSAEGFRASNLNSWNNDFFLRLGNEKDRSKGWLGTLYSVAVYSRSLSDEEIQTNFSAQACDSLTHTVVVNVSLFPNPVTDEAYLEIDPIAITDYSPITLLRIIDAFGTVLSEQPIFNPNERFSKILDFKKYHRGIYFLQVISGDTQKTTKLILQ